jgi:hypothetical protein
MFPVLAFGEEERLGANERGEGSGCGRLGKGVLEEFGGLGAFFCYGVGDNDVDGEGEHGTHVEEEEGRVRRVFIAADFPAVV